MSSRYPGGVVRKTAANTSITGASGVWDLGSQAQAVRTNTWPISGLANPVSGSLRFRSSASPFLSRTASSSPTSNQKLTISFWFKPSLYRLASEAWLFSCGTGSGRFGLYYNVNASWGLEMQNAEVYVRPSRVWRDPSAWYHIVIAVDSTQATSSNRVKWYTNGVLEDNSGSGASYPNQNITFDWNGNGTLNYIGRFSDGRYYDGYLAEFYSVDGQQLTPSSFGQTSPITGVWEPIKYTSTYGTNGFYLSLSDTSSIGKDFSGNGNNWTPNNISTASGSTFDLMRDVPTQYIPQGVTDVGGTVRGNYCTWNPLNKSSNHNSTNGNLTASSSGGTSYGAICGTMGVSSGKWYWEMTYTRNGSTNSPVIGFGNDLFRYTNPPDGYLGSDLNAGGINVINGNAALNAVSTAYGSAIATNDVVIFAMDLDNRKFYIGKNGTWFNSGNPVAGTNQWPYSATIVGSTFFPAVNMFNDTGDANFGQRPFAYTPPSGFKSLCTTNLPTPTIGATAATAANKYFNTVLYTGNGAASRPITGVGFQPDMVWTKRRSTSDNHHLFDSVRVVSSVPQRLFPNLTNVEDGNFGSLDSFDADGFTLGANVGTNASGETFVAWSWKAGDSTVTNTTGSISSQVRANPTTGFSILTYTGNGTGGATVGHGLGVAPSMMIFKTRAETGAWLVWHTGYGSNQAQTLLNTNAAIFNPGNGLYFNSTFPSSTVATLGTSGATNGNGTTYVAYMFAPVAGFSAFGSYTGNGSTDGPFVHTGFRPRFVLIKRTNAAEDWNIWDSSRSPFNLASVMLRPNSTDADDGTVPGIDLLSNGFKWRNTWSGTNASGSTYIYMAFAENPFKNALAR